MNHRHFKVLILGGGSGGISVAARLAKHQSFRQQIGIVEPSENHFYQPYWTLAGTGIVCRELSRRPQEKVIPRHTKWIKDVVVSFQPEANTVETKNHGRLTYDVLVVALGIELNFEKIKGLNDHLGKNGIISVYRFDQLESAAKTIQDFKGGTAIFTMPPVPIKCAGAPQKVMYLAEHLWRQAGVRDRTRIVFASAGAAIFGVKDYVPALNRVLDRKQIETKFNTKLIEVRAHEKIAIFSVTNHTDATSVTEEIPYDLLHVVPPMSCPRVVRDSALASQEDSQKGWLEVDDHSLQHKRFPNVFGIGDVTGIPNSKTGAAIRKQAPVVVKNIERYLRGWELCHDYNGYASCPLITDIGRVILAEFGYGGKLMPSFPLDSTKERKIYWHLKKDLLPHLYWNGMLKGRF